MAESGNSLGEYLRRERERRGVTIEQVASATKINVRLLHSLESDQFSELPAKPFIRGFVASYARFVGLDAQEILVRFEPYISEKSHERPNRESGHSGYAFEKKEGEKDPKPLWIGLGAALILVIAVLIFVFSSMKSREMTGAEKLRTAHATPTAAPTVAPPSPEPSVSPSAAPTLLPMEAAHPSASPVPSASPSPKPSGSPAPARTPIPTPSPSANPEDPLNSGIQLKPAQIRHRVVFKTLAPVWVRYQSDSRPITQFAMKAGVILVLRAEEVIRFQTSNPKSLQFSYNGRGYQPVADAKSLTMRQNTATLIFPSQASETIQDPFPGASELPQTPDPE